MGAAGVPGVLSGATILGGEGPHLRSPRKAAVLLWQLVLWCLLRDSSKGDLGFAIRGLLEMGVEEGFEGRRK